METKVFERVEEIIEEIRPLIQADGGDIELVGVVEGIVRIRLSGACEGCMASQYTIGEGVERILKDRVPEVKEVIAQ